MKGRVRYWLGAVAPAAVVLLLMVPFLLGSPCSLNNTGRKSLVSGGARKLLSVKTTINPSPSLSSQDQRRVESKARARKQPVMKQVGASMRRIPPSTSNPTQNKAGLSLGSINQEKFRISSEAGREMKSRYNCRNNTVIQLVVFAILRLPVHFTVR